MALTAIPS
ncbi:hypothetical protein AWZ03_008646, partial [Drosophila navojoa]